MKMENTNLANNYKLFSFEKIPSTQTTAHEMINDGRANDHFAIMAAAQSAGRGRYRRIWVSHHGNLYVSFIFSAPERDPRLSYAVAVAVAESLRNFGIEPEIKWPNDILIKGKKVSGILIEYSKNFVIVGIGINIKSNPTVTGVGYTTTKLDLYKKGIQREELLAVLMTQLDIWIPKIKRGNFTTVRNRWTEMASGLNQEIKFKGKNAVLCGINDEGALVLRSNNEYILTVGDIG